MKTELIYKHNPQLMTVEAKIIELEEETIDGITHTAILLDKTPFYPQGGGQPSDIGTIVKGSALFQVEKVYKDKEADKILHLGTIKQGYFNKGDTVKVSIDKDVRSINIIYHSAGHIIDLAVRNLAWDYKPIKGYHYKEAAYVQYQGEPRNTDDLQKEVDKIIKSALNMKVVCIDEHKSVLHIGDDVEDLCGGTHADNTSKLAGLKIVKIKKEGSDNVRIRYEIVDNASSIEFSDIIKEMDSQSLTAKQFEDKYLGKNGLITNLLQEIKNKSGEERAEYGKKVNILKMSAQEKWKRLLEAEKTAKKSYKIDLTAPFGVNSEQKDRPQLIPDRGHKNPLSAELEEISKIFLSMGFSVQDARQLDSDYNMFTALNFPDGHPARDMWDTFHTEEGLIPTTHTSTMQNRILKSNKPPIRFIVPGTCYRNEATDDRHEHTLAHLEGIYVDKGISLSNMEAVMHSFLEEYYQTKLEVKLQPSHFPFVEPGLELCMSCPFCKKTGCSTCGHHGWIELVGCGVIHPNVLSLAGIDPNIYSGFAWGFGLDRLVMIRAGIKNIRDIRGGNLDFLKQF
jgi:phenylalanyl-tRNA synthetase alpha chain